MGHNHYRSIDYLRCIFACYIAVWHGAGAVGHPLRPNPDGLYGFLLLSGLFAFREREGGDREPLGFFVLRLARFAPIYWIATLLLASKMVVGHSNQGSFDAGRLILSLLFIPHFNAAHQPYPLLISGWYLTYEVFFAAVLATCVMTPAKARLPLVTALIVGLVLLGAAFHPTGAIGMRMTSQALLLFPIGGWIGRIRGLDRARPWPMLSLLAIAMLLYAAPYSSAVVDRLPILVSGAPGALVICAAIGLDRFLPSIPPLTRIGQSAYSLYIWHPMVVSVVLGLAVHAHGAPAWMIIAVCGVASAGAGVMMNRWLELPINSFLTPRLRAMSDRAPAALKPA